MLQPPVASTAALRSTFQAVPQDVNNSGNVTELDALVIVNSLSRQRTAGGETPRRQVLVDDRYDVNQDGVVSAIDALMVINYLSRNKQSINTAGPFGDTSQFAGQSLEDDRKDWPLAVDGAFEKLQGNLFCLSGNTVSESSGKLMRCYRTMLVYRSLPATCIPPTCIPSSQDFKLCRRS